MERFTSTVSRVRACSRRPISTRPRSPIRTGVVVRPRTTSSSRSRMSTAGSHPIPVSRPSASTSRSHRRKRRPVRKRQAIPWHSAAARHQSMQATSSDCGPPPITFQLAASPVHGNLTTFNSTTGAFTYKANSGYAGGGGFPVHRNERIAITYRRRRRSASSCRTSHRLRRPAHWRRRSTRRRAASSSRRIRICRRRH